MPFEIISDEIDFTNLYETTNEGILIRSERGVQGLENRVTTIPEQIVTLSEEFHAQSDRRIDLVYLDATVLSEQGGKDDIIKNMIDGAEAEFRNGRKPSEYREFVKGMGEFIELARIHHAKDYAKLLRFFQRKIKENPLIDRGFQNSLEAIRNGRVYLTMKLDAYLKPE